MKHYIFLWDIPLMNISRRDSGEIAILPYAPKTYKSKWIFLVVPWVHPEDLLWPVGELIK